MCDTLRDACLCFLLALCACQTEEPIPPTAKSGVLRAQGHGSKHTTLMLST